MRHLNYSRFTVAVIMATVVAETPARANDSDAPPGVELRTIVAKVPIPEPGQPVEMPEVVPSEFRAELAAKVRQASPGDLVVITSANAGRIAPLAVQRAITAAQGTINPNIWCFIICVIIILIVVTVVICALLKMCQAIKPPDTNSDIWNDPTLALPTPEPPGALTLVSGDVTTGPIELQYCTNLVAGDWYPLAELRVGLTVTVTNCTPAIDVCQVTVTTPGGQMLGQTLHTGMATDWPTLYQRTAPIQVPAPSAPQMFLRLKGTLAL